jgi:hypothetical protein
MAQRQKQLKTLNAILTWLTQVLSPSYIVHQQQTLQHQCLATQRQMQHYYCKQLKVSNPKLWPARRIRQI